MAEKVVEIPGVGVVSFPDSMSDDDVSVAAKKLHDDYPHMSAPKDTDPITLADWTDNPMEAARRTGALLKRDASDPKLWLGLAASYFAPKVFRAVAPTVRNAAAAAARTGKAVAGVVEPGDVGIVSPRIGKAVDLVQRVRAATAVPEPVAPPAAAAPVAAPAATAPVAAAPVAPVVAEPVVQAPKPPKFTAAESKEIVRLRAQGTTKAAAENAVMAARKINESLKAKTPAEIQNEEILLSSAAEAEFARQYAARMRGR